MQNGDEALPSIILAGRAFLVKILIILEPHGIFSSNFVYYYILFLTGNHQDFSLKKIVFYLWPLRLIHLKRRYILLARNTFKFGEMEMMGNF